MKNWCHRLFMYILQIVGTGIALAQVTLLTQFVAVIPCFTLVPSSTAFTTIINNYHHIQTKNSVTIRKPDIHQHYTVKKRKYNQNLGKFERLDLKSISNWEEKKEGEQHYDGQCGDRIVKLYDFSLLDSIKFQLMWDIQKDIVEGHVQRLKVEFEKKQPASQFWSMREILNSSSGDEVGKEDGMKQQLIIDISDRAKGCDSIIMLQHEPVYTLGTASDENFIKSIGDDIDVVRIERGGEVTYHGPGQLTVYPIIDLRGYKQDIHWYMRALEEAIILSLQNVGISGVRKDVSLSNIS